MSTRGAVPDTTELASHLRLAVTRLARKLRQESELGLSLSLHAALSTIERAGAVTLGDLAACEQVQPPTMTRIVSALVDAGLVTREADPADGRVAWVLPTVEGRRLLQRSRRRKEAYLAQRLREVPPEDLEVLERAASILERLTEGR